MFDGIMDKLAGASSDAVDNALDSALESTNSILIDSSLDPLNIPEITVPLSVKIPGGFLGSVSGELSLTDGSLAGLATFARQEESQVDMSSRGLEASVCVSLGPLSCPFSAGVSCHGVSVDTPTIAVQVDTLGVRVSLSMGLGSGGPDVELEWQPPIDEIEVDVTMDLPDLLAPLHDLIMSSVMEPVRERVREKVGGIVSQELKQALENLGPKDLLGA